MSTFPRTVFAAALAAVLSAASPATAQVTTGEITGRVTDAQGSGVPGATVMAENTRTALQRITTSGATGEYTLSQLPPGIYTISAELQGFRKITTSDLEVNVGTRRTLNLQLEVGSLAETVEVAAEAALIETTKSEIAGVVTPTEIQSLPILNRTFAALSVIMPEARPVGNFDPTKARMGSVAMSGGDGRQLDVNVDGGDNKDNVVGSLLQNFAYESIQEFQVLQHRWSAESGRSVGGVVNVITKSGNNDLRGSLFGNGRHQDTRAKDFFEKELDRDKSAFSRQEFGGSVGGPIRRDSLFYFGAIERFRERQNTPVRAAAVPQLQALQGVLGINPVTEIPQPYDDTLLSIKVDHRLSDRQTMAYRYSQQNNSSPNDQVGSPANTDLTGGNTTTNDLYSFLVNHSLTIGPTKLNQFSFHFQDFLNEKLSVTDTPNIVFPTVQTGANVNVPQATSVRKWQFRNDFTWHAGSHGLKSGVNYIRTDMGGFFYFGARGHRVHFFDDPLTILGNAALYPQGFGTPGAVRLIELTAGEGDFELPAHQLALYAQDDWRVSQRLTLNLGFRWDANIGFLPDQTDNRTMQILRQLDEPRAQEIAGNAEKLRRRTPSWTEFQPRLGFAFDPRGDGRSVVRGGYGIFYDQVFLNLTLFSIQQTRPTIFQQALTLTNTAVGTGQIPNFRFGVDPLPGAPPGTSPTDLAFGGFGRINDPDMTDPYVHKLSLGFQHSLTPNWSVSSDYVHTRGVNEARVQVINPFIRDTCDPSYPGSTPGSPRCVRGANSRYFDEALVAAGFPIQGGRARVEQINMIGTTNSSRFDSWTTSLRGRLPWGQASISYVLANSRSWGGQPTASYSGNGIATTPENQFKAEEWGPTRIDERHRFVASGAFNLPYQVQLAPVVQFATARPYSLNAGFDLDGDGLAANDRICAGVDPRAVFDARGNSAAVRALNPIGCQQVGINSQRGGFIVNPDGSLREVSGRYLNVDLRVAKAFTIRGFNIKPYADFYNLFNTENLSLSDRLGLSYATSGAGYTQPVSLFGPGFGPPVGRPLTAVFGARLDF
jgi:hypothetical protein